MRPRSDPFDMTMCNAPRLKPTVDIRELPDGRLLVLRADLDGQDLELEGDTGWIATFLSLLDGRRGRDELAEEIAASGLPGGLVEISEALDELGAAGLLEDGGGDALLDDYTRERFSRQLAYFADVSTAGSGAVDAQRRLADVRICILGVGGLGSWTAYALASTGVGGVRLVDGDVVELSNLNRQVLYDEVDIGRQKVDVAGERLRAFAPRMNIETLALRADSAKKVARAIAGCDFVVDAADSPPGKIDRWVNEAAFALGIPYLAMSQHPPRLRVGPLYAPGETGCHACLETQFRRGFPAFDELAAVAPTTSRAATFGPACAAVGSLAAAEIAHFLSGLMMPATLGRSVTIDLRDLSQTWAPVTAIPTCRTCGGKSTTCGAEGAAVEC